MSVVVDEGNYASIYRIEKWDWMRNETRVSLKFVFPSM